MGPLWAEIMDHILPVVNEDQEDADRGRPPAKLAIYSGHDTTIMMILESLGSKVKAIEWPPYASMILIEVSSVLFVCVCMFVVSLATESGCGTHMRLVMIVVVVVVVVGRFMNSLMINMISTSSSPSTPFDCFTMAKY
jgi:hypothetical protein